LAAVAAHRPSEAVRARALAQGLDLEALRRSEPLTYAAINAVALVRTTAGLAAQVQDVVAGLGAPAQLFSVPLRVQGTDTELRVFPPLTRGELERFDQALGTLAAEGPGGLFYRTVADSAGERRELAYPVAPESWQPGAALVGPFADEAAAAAWGQAHTDPRTGLVYDVLPYAGAWFCDVFRGER
jgi:hypothetical protein